MEASETKETFIVAGSRPWSRDVFDKVIGHYPGRWHFVQSREELTTKLLKSLNPRYVFFLHWSWRVHDEIIDAYECVAFHMTDLPYGRGGTPLQNLILRGHKRTELTAFRMTRDLDSGPIYLKENLELHGSAEEIYERASHLAAEMIRRIIREQPTPSPQQGEVVVFERRRPEESEIPDLKSLAELYDFIRMLDAEGYPRAFFVRNRLRYEFSGASLGDRYLTARVTVALMENEEA